MGTFQFDGPVPRVSFLLFSGGPSCFHGFGAKCQVHRLGNQSDGTETISKVPVLSSWGAGQEGVLMCRWEQGPGAHCWPPTNATHIAKEEPVVGLGEPACSHCCQNEKCREPGKEGYTGLLCHALGKHTSLDSFL